MKKKIVLQMIFILSCVGAIAVVPVQARTFEGEPTGFSGAGIVSHSQSLSAAGVAVQSGPASVQAPKRVKYTVKSGDTLYRIARHFDTTVGMLQKKNHIVKPRQLQIGRVLLIPAGTVEALPAMRNDADVVKVLQATLTAYTAGVESTGKTSKHPSYGITFSGTRAKEGRTIAVDPKVIPLGSKVYIEGLGVRTAEDIGSAVKGVKIDIFMDDVKQARKFGVQKNRKVYVFSNAEVL